MKNQSKKKKAVKIIVKPYYIGENTQGEIFRRIIIGEVRRKLKLHHFASDNYK